MTMINELLERGYKQIDKHEFVKSDWTIRFEKDIIEVFDDPENGTGYYFSGNVHKVNLNTLLDEVDDFLLD